jgi:hypothetical protein
MDDFAPIEKESLLKTGRLTCSLREHLIKRNAAVLADMKKERKYTS